MELHLDRLTIHHATRIQAFADALLALSDDTAISAIATLIGDSASDILLADAAIPTDPEDLSFPPPPPGHPMCPCVPSEAETEPSYHIPGKREHLRRLDPDELREELELGEVTTIPEAIQMLLADKYTTSDLSHAIGCRNCEIDWAAQGGKITKEIKDYFRPLLPREESNPEEA